MNTQAAAVLKKGMTVLSVSSCHQARMPGRRIVKEEKNAFNKI